MLYQLSYSRKLPKKVRGFCVKVKVDAGYFTEFEYLRAFEHILAKHYGEAK